MWCYSTNPNFYKSQSETNKNRSQMNDNFTSDLWPIL